MNALRAAWAIAAKDLRIEWRSRTAILTASLFAILVELIIVFGRDAGTVSYAMLAPSVLWITIALSSLVALNRAFLLEREHGALEGILAAPVNRSALFWGKWFANLVFVLAVVTVAFPLWVLFFNVEPSTGLYGVMGLAVLGAIGFTAVGTVFSAMTVRTRHAELLLPVLMLPFMLPPVFFAAQATMRLLGGRPMEELWGWLRLLALFDVVFLVLATLIFPAVVDE
ncbi:MAG: heme exporter protein CcmB [Gemmatimonadales bacterium]|jgi:heme exporter protein B|nr:heme exporter protein CcmB [Gemmatimonadales bacterium]MDZ4257922.1 heme exporter protein CcmB [Gemmatimonadales bacterium]MDZ4391275.1 heme exporter protein CcmB [Gemmatimonadales bacterium]PKL90520.1 MAG: heme ABC transporter permease [Gemmatimonadetes bacterium HGW-Gemmatimonadetes-1]